MLTHLYRLAPELLLELLPFLSFRELKKETEAPSELVADSS